MQIIRTEHAPYGRNLPDYCKHEQNLPEHITQTVTMQSERKHSKESVKAGFRIACNKQRWHDFTLNRGHIFGVYNCGYYVSTGEIVEFRKNKRGETVAYYQLYYERGNADNFRWSSSSISERTPLGKQIAAMAAKSGGVDYKPNTDMEYRGMMKPSAANVNISLVIK